MNDCLVISNGYCIKAQNKCGRRGLYYTVGNITICIKKKWTSQHENFKRSDNLASGSLTHSVIITRYSSSKCVFD